MTERLISLIKEPPKLYLNCQTVEEVKFLLSCNISPNGLFSYQVGDETRYTAPLFEINDEKFLEVLIRDGKADLTLRAHPTYFKEDAYHYHPTERLITPFESALYRKNVELMRLFYEREYSKLYEALLIKYVFNLDFNRSKDGTLFLTEPLLRFFIRDIGINLNSICTPGYYVHSDNLMPFYGKLPLILFASVNLETLTLFLSEGADINYADNEGNTALHHLSKILNKSKGERFYEMTEKTINRFMQNLVIAGADVLITNVNGWTYREMLEKNLN